MNIQRNRIVIDATDKAVGRVATEAAMALRGKNKPTFTPHIDGGDFVEVINIEKLKFTGRKFVQKDYYRHTLFPGGLKVTPLKRLFETNPTEVVKKAVYGMLPKNKLRNEMLKRLTLKV